ncbi:DNA sulfur modification protein DndB [Persephonella atlantica]|uniref:DNA sulfur modification protein DndB n=1 Tax=Persephonella atlantica TaxID=2699429 RepID=A0ABS1GJM7_9AQUI|nr:DNA sulfur modification protein DndB [Persephonella atlantica]MBK3333121.1 DNA sulfur modification protein DndB [Persephonella atlantica]
MSYLFPAVRGIQANKEYYTVMCQLKLIPEIFKEINLPIIPPKLRAQRILNKSRVPAIKRYILENPDSYVFSSITVSVDGEVEFVPINEDNYQLGYLKISEDAKFIINDGQHRIEAIKQAIEENPLLVYETISMVIFVDLGLERSQQIFTDLNRFSVKPTPSISILYDYRDQIAELSRFLAENVYYFKDLVEYEKSSISNRSSKLFTLSSIYYSTKELLNKKEKTASITDEEREFSFYFWEEVGNNLPEWKKVKKGELPAYKAREKFITTHGLFLNAIAIVGRKLIDKGIQIDEGLRILESINWDRSNPEWEGIALNNGRLSKAYINIQKTAGFVLNKILEAIKYENKANK